MKKILILSIFMVLTASVFSGAPEKKTLLFNQIKDLRYRCRVNEYNQEVKPFGNQDQNMDLRTDLAQKRALIDSLETVYKGYLSDEELKVYLNWKHDEDLRDNSQSFNWWYQGAKPQDC